MANPKKINTDRKSYFPAFFLLFIGSAFAKKVKFTLKSAIDQGNFQEASSGNNLKGRFLICHSGRHVDVPCNGFSRQAGLAMAGILQLHQQSLNLGICKIRSLFNNYYALN
jgi:hypothetical protein